jgi:hypothetical protein
MLIACFLYLFICILAPYLFTRFSGNYSNKTTEISVYSHALYGVFALLSLVLEITTSCFAYWRVKHLIPGAINTDELDKGSKSLVVKSKLLIGKYQTLFLYAISLLSSQVSRYDLYSDVCFVVICFMNDFLILGTVSLVVIGI